jgi:4-amino-4-deoxy-L-arabinose transferase-like glycosyltransferase
LVFVATVALYAWAMAPVPFYGKGDAREALVVRAILEGHGVILPRRDGHDIPSKPPFFHWLAALAARAGVTPAELAMRLPSIVLAAGALALVAARTAAAHGPAAGVLAAAVLGSSLEWLRAATASRVDMTLTACVLVAILCWHAGGRLGVRIGYLAAALAVLTKGPVGLVLPVLVAGADALAARDPARLRRLADLPGAALAGAVVIGWYLLAWQSGGAAFVERQVLHENLVRFAGGRHAAHAHGPLYYLPALAAGFFPWTFALPGVIGQLWRRRTEADRFHLVWIAAVVVFYSLASGKRAVYVLPAYPPLAILTAQAVAAGLGRPPGARARAGLLAMAAVLGALAVAVALGWHERLAAIPPHLLSKSAREILPAVLVLVSAHWTGVVLALSAATACLGALAVRRVAGGRLALAACVVLALVWGLGLTTLGVRPLALRMTPRPFGARVQALVGAGDGLCAQGYVDFPVRWYLGRALVPCAGGGEGDAGRRTFVVRPAGAGAPRRNPCLRTLVVDESSAPEHLELAEWIPGCRLPAAGG